MIHPPAVRAPPTPAGSPASPFTDPAAQPSLYATADRLARRTRVLRAARIAGRPAEQVIADLAVAEGIAPSRVVADVG